MTQAADRMRDWRGALAVYADRRILTILALGFASGLPSPLVFSNLSIWLRDEGVSRTDIGLFALVATPYAINFLWAPLIDRMRLPWLTRRFGRRRGWALATQAVLLLAILAMAGTDPGTALLPVAVVALAISIASATQDIVIDAYRVELLEPARFGAGSAAAIWGWHLGGTLVGGAGGLLLADAFGWQTAYAVLALAVGIGMVAVLMSPEPERAPDAETLAREAAAAARLGAGRPRAWATTAAWLYGAVVAPLADFMTRRGWLLILVFIFVFKLGDALLGRMSGVFYRELGFGLDQIAEVAKVYGMAANAVGILIGGWMVARFGTLRALFAGGLAAAATNLAYAALASSGADPELFRVAVVADNFTGGLATVAFVAYLSGLCNVAYTATQYALLASLGNLARIWFSASAGAMVDGLDGDWATFFMLTAVVALAGLPLLSIIMRRHPDSALPPDVKRRPTDAQEGP
ncbi:MAG TPA: MFS transporter [Pseudomonadales bacterium]|nr:MFS transporter [Pseudomonadales bacterium]